MSSFRRIRNRIRIFTRRLIRRIQAMAAILLLVGLSVWLFRLLYGFLEPDIDALLTPEQKIKLAGMLEHIRVSSPSDDFFIKCERGFRKALAFKILNQSTLHNFVDDNFRKLGCIDIYSRVVSTPSPELSQTMPVTVLPYQNILYIRIRTFLKPLGNDARRLDDWGKDLARLIKGNITAKIYLDMRGNGGGDVEEMRRVLEHFSPRPGIPYGHVIKTHESKARPKFISASEGELSRLPITIFVDRQCASACEWLSLILRTEWFPKTTMIVGEPTVGKGVVQCVGAITVTCETIEVNGRPYHGVPIQPDLVADFSACPDIDIFCVMKAYNRVSR